MNLRVALQMDPPSSLNVNKDSSFLLGLEAQKRGHDLFYYSSNSLSLTGGVLSADVAPLEFHRKKDNHFTLGQAEKANLNELDLILMRQDFVDPLSYNATTHMLDHLIGKTLVLNDPKGVRESPEKMLITHFPDITPPTLISRDLAQIKEFYNEHKSIIVKPFNGFGGLDIFHIHENAKESLEKIYETLSQKHTEPFIVQKYLPEIKTKGDKRLILIEGAPVGAFTRIAQDGSARANLAAGGIAHPSKVTDRDRDICAQIKPELIKRGLVLVGLDIIGDYATEINPKSPTGLQQINGFDGVCLEAQIWDAYEARLNDQ